MNIIPLNYGSKSMHISPSHHFLTSSRDVKEICKPLLKISVNYFSYTRSYNDGRRLYLITSPDWLYNYFNRDFHLIGNCELKPRAYQNAQIYLRSTLPNQIIYNDALSFGIQDGLFIVNPGKEYTEFFEFSSLKPDINMMNVYLNNFDFLQNFKNYFVVQAQKLIEPDDSQLILPHRKEKSLFSDIKAKANIDKTAAQQTNLTPQQYQCAVRLLEGKSQKLIAEELNLSPRTVETYLNNLKSKLGAVNKTELVIRLIQLGIK